MGRPADAAVQFACGGRVVGFAIPANTTEAVFNAVRSRIALQTGTLAGNVVITPAFATEAQSSPPTLVMTFPALPPELLSSSLTARSLNTFAVAVNGYSTTRALRRLEIELVPRQGTTLSSNKFTIDVNSAATAWFQAGASQSFGSAFSVVVPFARGRDRRARRRLLA